MNAPSPKPGGSDHQQPKLQFTLRDLFVATFAVALALGVSIWLGPYGCLASSAIFGAWLECRIRLAGGRPLKGSGTLGGSLAGAVGIYLLALRPPRFVILFVYLDIIAAVIVGGIVGAVFGKVYRWSRKRCSPGSEQRE